MEAILQLPGVTPGERWRGGLREEAGAQTTAGGVYYTDTCGISTKRYRSSSHNIRLLLYFNSLCSCRTS